MKAATITPSSRTPRLSDALTSFHSVLHHNLLLCLMASYALATFLPGLGNEIRTWHFPVSAGPSVLSLLLGLLLFNAGMNIRSSELRGGRRLLAPLVLGVFVNFAFPALYVALCSRLSADWHNVTEMQTLLLSLTLIGSMPIAGASATWAQESDGNLTLSLGLIFFSTILSPWTSPLAFRFASYFTLGEHHDVLVRLANDQTSNFLFGSVVAPTLLGLICHFALGERRCRSVAPFLKTLSILALLTLNYSNAASALPTAIRHPNLDFLAISLAATLVLCVSSFGMGYLLSKALRMEKGAASSLVFGLGMNNNGTGLVFASLYLSSMPVVGLPIVLYNLEQQLIAGLVQWARSQRHDQEDEEQTDLGPAQARLSS